MIDRARFARQLSLPEVGERGQRALGESRARIEGDSRATDAATRYLERAGCTVSDDGVLVRVSSVEEITRIAGRPELEEAAAWISGCVAAATHIARTVGVCGADAPRVPELS